MFIHSLKYSLKTLFRNKSLIFWTFAFPIILGILFNMALSNITKTDKFKVIDIAIVENNELEENSAMKTVFNELSDDENKDKVFNIKYVSEEKAKKLLEDGIIKGYLKIENNKPKIMVMENGIDQTVFKYIVESIWQSKDLNSNIIKANIKNISGNNLDFIMIEYYTLIAMTALYGGNISCYSINQVMPNLSNKGKRISVSPVKKSTIIFSSLLASYIVQIISLIIVFLFTILIFKVNYGDNLGLIVLLALMGSLAGLVLGLFVGVVLKVNENSKIGILIGITMLGCFFSGMMGITTKYTIDTNIPIINKLNPANMITDGFYSLYYYSNLDRYWVNIFSLIIFIVILIFILLLKIRRQKYDSI